jgi:transposase
VQGSITKAGNTHVRRLLIEALKNDTNLRQTLDDMT